MTKANTIFLAFALTSIQVSHGQLLNQDEYLNFDIMAPIVKTIQVVVENAGELITKFFSDAGYMIAGAPVVIYDYTLGVFPVTRVVTPFLKTLWKTVNKLLHFLHYPIVLPVTTLIDIVSYLLEFLTPAQFI